MLVSHGIFKNRSTKRLSAKQMQPIGEQFRNSRAIYAHETERMKKAGRKLKFRQWQMMVLLFFMEIKRLSYADLVNLFDGRGGQVILRNLGMPECGGRYIYPSEGWVSEFRNKEYPKFMRQLEGEIREEVLRIAKERGNTVFTVDSTPQEASRYSKWADFNVHYGIRMAKAHIIMADGMIVQYRITNGNAGDGPELKRLLDIVGDIRIEGARFLADGGYDDHEIYRQVYRRTGIVMSGNAGKNATIHKEASMRNLIKRYNRLHDREGFVPVPRTTPDRMLRFLMRNGEDDITGWFLRNLDISRGKRIHARDAKDRHVCETVHHAMKRWICFDVRGIWSRFVGIHMRFKMMVCSILSVVFRPYI